MCARASGRLQGDARQRAYGREYLRHNVERGHINNVAFPMPVYIHRFLHGEFMQRLHVAFGRSLIKVSTQLFTDTDRTIIGYYQYRELLSDSAVSFSAKINLSDANKLTICFRQIKFSVYVCSLNCNFDQISWEKYFICGK